MKFSQTTEFFFFFFSAVMNIALKGYIHGKSNDTITQYAIKTSQQLYKHRNCKHFPRGRFSINEIHK